MAIYRNLRVPSKSNRKITTLLVLSLLIISAFSCLTSTVSAKTITVGVNTPPAIDWDQTYSTSSLEWIYSMAKTSDGGYVLAGLTYAYGNGADFWLVKVSSSGNMEWQKNYGGSEYDCALSVVQTNDGGYALAGYTFSSEFKISGSIASWLIIKTDSSGNLDWYRVFGEEGDNRASCIIQSSDGGLTVAGRYSDGYLYYWVVKLSSSGADQWDRKYGGSGHSEPNYLIQTSDGGYAIAGYTTAIGAGNSDFYLIKTRADGSEEWHQTYGTAGYEGAKAVIQTSDGGYALLGYANTNSIPDYLLVKTNSAGVQEWSQKYAGSGSSSYDSPTSLIQTIDGGYALLGNTGTYSISNLWLVKTDLSGNKQWGTTYGTSAGDDKAAAVLQEADGSFVLAGYTNSKGAGNYDGWLIKTKPYINYDFGSIQSAVNNAAPGDTIQIKPGTYTENIVINKPITLIGDDAASTIINGLGTSNTIKISSDDVTISGLTIKNSGSSYPQAGVFLDNVENSRITTNIITNNGGYGVYVNGGANNIISGNAITNAGSSYAAIGVQGGFDPAQIENNQIRDCNNAIKVTSSQGVVVKDNSLKNIAENGILLGNSADNELTGNTVEGANYGIISTSSQNNALSGNTVQSCNAGLYLAYGSGNTVQDNSISNSFWAGVYFDSEENDHIYHNRFIDNAQQVYVSGTATSNVWDAGSVSGGNYWSDYTGVDSNGDGFGDSPYVIDPTSVPSVNIDHYPFIGTHTMAMATTIGQLTGGSLIVDHLAITGVSVYTDDTRIPEGMQLTVATINYGSNQPDGTSAPISVGGVFYDVKVTAGELNPDCIIYVTFQNPGFQSGNQIQYYDGSNWVTVPTTYQAPDKLVGEFHLSELQGTPIFVTPESAFGALSALIACLFAFLLVKRKTSGKAPSAKLKF